MQQRGQCRRRFLAASVCFAVFGRLTTRQAQAMMAPIHYTRARLNAAHHIQLAIERVTGGKVRGRVVTVFRGALKTGARLTLQISLRDETNQAIVGGTIYTDPDALARARFLEAFLDGDPPAIVMDQVKIIDAATPEPVGDWRRESFLW